MGPGNERPQPPMTRRWKQKNDPSRLRTLHTCPARLTLGCVPIHSSA